MCFSDTQISISGGPTFVSFEGQVIKGLECIHHEGLLHRDVEHPYLKVDANYSSPLQPRHVVPSGHLHAGQPA